MTKLAEISWNQVISKMLYALKNNADNIPWNILKWDVFVYMTKHLLLDSLFSQRRCFCLFDQAKCCLIHLHSLFTLKNRPVDKRVG